MKIIGGRGAGTMSGAVGSRRAGVAANRQGRLVAGGGQIAVVAIPPVGVDASMSVRAIVAVMPVMPVMSVHRQWGHVMGMPILSGCLRRLARVRCGLLRVSPVKG